MARPRRDPRARAVPAPRIPPEQLQRRRLDQPPPAAAPTGPPEQPSTTDGAPVYKTDQCGCKARIIWAVIVGKTKRVCVDADPVGPTAGTVVLSPPSPGVTPTARILNNPADRFGRRWVYRRHLETCPHAGHYRNKARRSHA